MIMRLRKPSLMRDRSGATIVEFALIAPVLILITVGIIELALVIFIASTIESAVFEASRFGITGNAPGAGGTREDQIREIVASRTLGLVDMDDVEIVTLVYDSFADIGQPEPFVDADANGAFTAGEPFTDINGNGDWDADMGLAGLGGPGEVVVYQLTYSWGILTPVIRNVLGESVQNVSSVAVRNEPI